MLWDFYFFLRVLVCLVGGFHSMLIVFLVFFLDDGGGPHPLFSWLWKSVSREYKVMVVYRTEDISSELVLFLRHGGKLLS